MPFFYAKPSHLAAAVESSLDDQANIQALVGIQVVAVAARHRSAARRRSRILVGREVCMAGRDYWVGWDSNADYMEEQARQTSQYRDRVGGRGGGGGGQ